MPTCPLCKVAKAVSQQVPGYRIWVCDCCWRSAEDGWPKETEPAMFAALANASLLIPDRNSKGLLPREYAPPSDYAL